MFRVRTSKKLLSIAETLSKDTKKEKLSSKDLKDAQKKMSKKK
jgi:hypothetical protein